MQKLGYGHLVYILVFSNQFQLDSNTNLGGGGGACCCCLGVSGGGWVMGGWEPLVAVAAVAAGLVVEDGVQNPHRFNAPA